MFGHGVTTGLVKPPFRAILERSGMSQPAGFTPSFLKAILLFNVGDSMTMVIATSRPQSAP